MNEEHGLIGRRAVLMAGGALAGLLASACSTDAKASGSDDRFDLVFGPRFSTSGRLSGTFAGHAVDVRAPLPTSTGSANGTFEGEAINVTWKTADNSSLQELAGSLPASVEGSLAGPLSLTGIFNFQPGLLFRSATITGSSGGKPVRAMATNDGGRSSQAIQVAGSFAGTAFSVVNSLASDLSQGIVRGTVGSHPVQVVAKAQDNMVKVTGTYRGPLALFGIITGSLLFFL